MRDVVLQMHMTLDGFADSKQGFVPITDRGYWKELDEVLTETGGSKVDTLLLGKGTYKQFVGFWSKVASDRSAPQDWRDQARFLDETPKFVFSKTLPRVEWRNSTLVRGKLGREIARLKRRSGRNLLVPGGVAFPSALIQQDLVDEYLLSVVPIIQGGGRHRLFAPMAHPRNLKHVKTWTFRNGVVLHQYRRAEKPWRFEQPDVLDH
ncbi:MAG: dihydrofolate reductase family protein [Thermoplasmata archaeon]